MLPLKLCNLPAKKASSFCLVVVVLLLSATAFVCDGFEIINPVTIRPQLHHHLSRISTTTTTSNAPPPSSSSSSTTSTTTTALWMARMNNRGRNAPAQPKKPPMNDEITASQLRVVYTDTAAGKDEPLGVLSLQDAKAKAASLGDGLDLIMINDKSDPPVCKIADYSKYRYMQEKKQKEIRKKSKATELKEVKMSYKIDAHDYEVRRKNAAKFISQGNRVKCTVMFRGREVQHDALGYDLLDKMAGDLDDVAVREGKPKREGRNLMHILQPRPEVVKRVNAERRAGEKAKKKQKMAALEEKTKQKQAKASSGREKEEEQINGAAVMDTTADANNIINGEDGTADDDDVDVESSLDDLLGSDDLTGKLFD